MNSTQTWDQRSQKAQEIASLVARGRKLVEVDKYHSAIRKQATLRSENGHKGIARQSTQNFAAMQAELMRHQQEKAERDIGPFAFDYDDDIESEVLTSEQVYRDLKELDDILGKNDALRTEGKTKARK